MANINIKISEEEKDIVFNAIKNSIVLIQSVAKIAHIAGINKNKVRYIVDDLVCENRINKTQIITYNEKYKRYIYTIGG